MSNEGASVYILLCADGAYYTGLTRKEVETRVSEHNAGINADFRNGPLGVKSFVSASPVVGGPLPSSSSPVSCFRPWSAQGPPHDAIRGNGEPI